MDDFTRFSSHVARKPHRCNDCPIPINTGDRYWVKAWRYEGEFCTRKSCDRCNQAWDVVEAASDWIEEIPGDLMDALIDAKDAPNRKVSDVAGEHLAELLRRKGWEPSDEEERVGAER